ncbi:MAG: ABC transporter permease subunit [Thermanaerothrix sp.]|nr:ABC transporter permease subunit [Thermanaerothrix sp.]
MHHLITIIDKEWAEVFKNKMVFFTLVFMPLLFTALPLISLHFMAGTVPEGADAADVPEAFLLVCGTFSARDCLQIYVIAQFMLLYMMMPLIIPITIAAYSVVGEKTTRSLEPLLATPITTEVLLAGKALAAVIPALVATWVCFGIFLLALPLVGAGEVARAHAVGPTWLLGIFVAAPLMAVAAVNFALMVSSRVNDPRVAEQLAAVLIVPLLGLFFAQIVGFIILSPSLMLIMIAVLLVLDVALISLGARLFQRETILTRWR